MAKLWLTQCACIFCNTVVRLAYRAQEKRSPRSRYSARRKSTPRKLVPPKRCHALRRACGRERHRNTRRPHLLRKQSTIPTRRSHSLLGLAFLGETIASTPTPATGAVAAAAGFGAGLPFRFTTITFGAAPPPAPAGAKPAAEAPPNP
ncbi:unnamed protein product, partial [Ectocarpus sp. 12 AP-2014]